MTAGDLVKEMISYYEGDPKRIQLFFIKYMLMPRLLVKEKVWMKRHRIF